MREINLSADQLAEALLALSETEQVCFLDSCGISNLGSHFLIAGINPLETFEISNKNANKTLEIFQQKLAENFASIFTISYEFGLKLNKIQPRPKQLGTTNEPDIFLAVFDNLIVYDYDSKKTFLKGKADNFDRIKEKLLSCDGKLKVFENLPKTKIASNFTRAEYLEKIEEIKELIRRGDTYQTNLTQQFRAALPDNLSPQQIFHTLRKKHPAPFSAFIKRAQDFVVSISPERFFKVQSPGIISTSPIKGTRSRGKNAEEDKRLREDLLNSAKDRAENVMIVDLLRNDLGRICEFGSVKVEKLCELETHPTLFHLVSTINGKLRDETTISDIIRAVFPCGSITGAPKISTMRIIDQIETATRGISMGAIGCFIKDENNSGENFIENSPFSLDLSVAIRTMTITVDQIVFNVGGGIVIDSDAEDEYDETLTKAKALFNSINAEF